MSAGGIGIALQPTDLGQRQALLGHPDRLFPLLEEVLQLETGLHVVGEARDHRLELVDGLVHQAVLPEHPALRQVLLDELGVLLAEGTRELDGRQRTWGLGRRRGGWRGHRWRRGRRSRGPHRRRLRLFGEREAQVLDLEVVWSGDGRRGPGRALGGMDLRPHEVELGAVLLVVGLHRDQDLEDRGGLFELPVADVGLGELGIGGHHRPVVLEHPVDLDQLVQGPDVGGVLLRELLHDRSRLLALPPAEQGVHRRQQLVVRPIDLAPKEVDPAHLDPGVLILWVRLEQLAEDGLGLVDLVAAEVCLAEARQKLGVPGGGANRLLEVAGRLVVVLLEQVDTSQLVAQPGARGVQLEPLLEDLERFREVPLLVELLGDGNVLLHGLGLVPVAGVEVGQLAADLQITGIDIDDLLEDVGGVPPPAPLQVLVDDDLVLSLGLHHEALLGVELGQVEVGVEGGGVELVDLLPDRDGLEQEAVFGVEVGDLGVLLGRVAGPPELGEKVADLVGGVPVAWVVVDDLSIELDRLLEAAGLLLFVGLLLGLDRVELAHVRPRTHPRSPRRPGPRRAG